MINYLYFIQSNNNGPIKVGIAKDINKRLSSLQTSNYNKLNLICSIECESRKQALELEHYLHKWSKKRKLHIRGEWFKPGIIDYFQSVISHIAGAKDKVIWEAK